MTLERVRTICDALPECVVEAAPPSADGGQHHKISVRGKTMGWRTDDHHGDGRVGLTLKASRGDNTVLVASDPTRFFLPKYVAQHGYVGVYVDRPDPDWDEIRELIVDAYRLVAPKSLAKLVN